ncbi:neutral zinc metallopeptidase [Arthrobacter sp. OAP107]|uniref:neutral zinc metallopeptidase n=1 Tax=Arthrobacter sp. OAP107 TaxID=3156445 RepID=UPI003394025F
MNQPPVSNARIVWTTILLTFSVVAIGLAVVVIVQPAWKGINPAASARTGSASPTSSTPSASPLASAPVPTPTVTETSSISSPSVPLPGPNLLADIQTAQRITDKFWARHWVEYFPGRYSPPNVLGTYDGTSPNAPYCGTAKLPAENASYCKPDDSVAWDITLMNSGYQQGDSWPYLVIAHEWGHAIQARLGNSVTNVAKELQADCLAGAVLFGAAADGDLVLETGDQKELASALSTLADETSWTKSADHGDPFERIGAFDAGRLHGVLECFPNLKPAQFGSSMRYESGVSVSVAAAGYRQLTPNPETTGRAAIFQITVYNGGTTPLNASHMSKLVIKFGETGVVGQLVPDPDAVLGPSDLGTIGPGDTKSIYIGAAVPKGQVGQQVRATVPGPDPEKDFSAAFEGS